MNTATLRLATLSDKTVKGAVRRICESLIEISGSIPDHNLSLISIEKLAPYDTDIAVKSFVANEKRIVMLKDMGISSSIDRILNESGIGKYPHLKAPIAQFKHLSEKSSDYMIVENYLGSLKNLLWDPVIKREYDSILEKAEGLKEEILVKKNVDIIGSSRNKVIYKNLLEKLDNYVFDRSSASRKFIIQDLDKYKFDATINRLANSLRMFENEDGGFNPLSNSTKCTIKPAIGFVQINESEDYFLLDNVVYKKKGDSMSFVSEKDAVECCESLLKVRDAMNRTGSYILNDSIMVPMGKNTIRISEDGEIFINEEKITRDQLTHKTTIASVVDPSQIRLLNDALTLHENSSKLMEIDFAKTITSNIYEGVRMNIIKGGNYVVNYKNPAMNESKVMDFSSARNLKSYVMDKLSFDISEAFTEVLTKEEAKITKQREKVNSIMEGLVTIERELKKVRKAIMEDDAVAENRNIRILEESLDSELKILKKTYTKEQTRLDEMVNMKPIASVGDKVKVGKKGTGTVLSFDGINRLFIVLMEDGHTIKCTETELSVSDPIIKKSTTALPEITMDIIKGSKGLPSDKKSGKKVGAIKESMVETDMDTIETIDIDDVEGTNEDPSYVLKHPEFGDTYDQDENRFQEMVQKGMSDYSPEEDEEYHEFNDLYSQAEEEEEEMEQEEDEYSIPLEERPFDEVRENEGGMGWEEDTEWDDEEEGEGEEIGWDEDEGEGEEIGWDEDEDVDFSELSHKSMDDMGERGYHDIMDDEEEDEDWDEEEDDQITYENEEVDGEELDDLNQENDEELEGSGGNIEEMK